MMSRGGTWNMLRGRDPQFAAATAYSLMAAHGMSWLLVQEARGYRRQLKRQAGARWELIAPPAPDGADAESFIILDAGVEHSPGRMVKLTRSGWFTVRGGFTGPKYATTVYLPPPGLRLPGLRLLAIHAAPSVNWRGGRIFGPVLRVISMRQFARSIVRFAGRHPGALVIGGDWNATPDDRGRYSPHWIARKTGMRIVAPDLPTHGREVIDFALVRGDGGARRLGKLGSDHNAVQLQVNA